MFKRLAVLAVAGFIAGVSCAAAPHPPARWATWTPLALTLYSDRTMLPRAPKVYGLELALALTGAKEVDGFQISGVWALAKKANGFQIATFRSEAQYGTALQLALFPLVEEKLRGIQIGLVDNLQFEDGTDKMHVIGAQISAMNSCKRLDGMQFGILNTSDLIRGGQIGVMNYGGDAGAFQIGIANIMGIRPDDEISERGLQIGLANYSTKNFHGVQIGLFNGCERLKGVQIGLINYVHNPAQPRLLLIPLINVGW